MGTFQTVYYRDMAGAEPVREFIQELGPGPAGVLRTQIRRLNLLSEAMPHLPFPHSSQVEGELRELRCHYGRDHFRILYRRSDRLIVLLHIFAKRTAKIPASEITVASDRWKDFKTRMDADPRTPPRPAGHDAP